jgi:hypothetical protein
MPVIAGQGSSAYLRRMIAPITRLLALIALVLMPLGMGAAAAAPQAAPHTAETGHCSGSEQRGPEAPLAPMADCTISCSAVAPDHVSAPFDKILPKERSIAVPIIGIAGVEPDIATPPPKSA